MNTISRRGLFGRLAAAAAVAVVSKLPAPEAAAQPIPIDLPVTGSYFPKGIGPSFAYIEFTEPKLVPGDHWHMNEADFGPTEFTVAFDSWGINLAALGIITGHSFEIA